MGKVAVSRFYFVNKLLKSAWLGPTGRSLQNTTQFCPYVQRTWIALEEKGILYQYKEVNPYKKEKHFLGMI